MSIRKYIKKQGGLFTKGAFDYWFFAILMAIIIVGLLTLYSASYPYAYYHTDSSTYYISRQLQGVVVGFILMMFISKLNYKIFYHVGGCVGTVIAWGLLVLARLMPSKSGVHRWITIGPIQFQPSDIAKLTLILMIAFLMDKYHDLVISHEEYDWEWAKKVNAIVGKPIFNKSITIVLISGGIVLMYGILVFMGSHLSGAILLLTIGVITMYLGEIRKGWFIAGILIALGGGFALYKMGILKDYMEQRLYAFTHKDFDPLGVRWQTNQALYAIGSGGLLGKGLGQSTQKYLYVSEPQNDMIFSIFCEEMGFIGAVLLILLFALLIWRGVVIGINSPTRYGAIIAMGISFQLAIQVILNIAVATDSVPNTGISLPFFSYGRTAMIVNMIGMGLVLSISRTSRIKRD